jgi:acyl-coenzyme A synthetase/AMP-(fatty) acid ligase
VRQPEAITDWKADVHEAAVVAEPHEKWGERPSAFVVLKPNSKWREKPKHFHEELKRYLKPRLAGFAIPENTRVVEELEKTSTGKGEFRHVC